MSNVCPSEFITGSQDREPGAGPGVGSGAGPGVGSGAGPGAGPTPGLTPGRFGSVRSGLSRTKYSILPDNHLI